MTEFFPFSDKKGPLKVIYASVPEHYVNGILVVDNVAAGPSIGGLRIAPDVTVEECFRLARAMTLKNAAAGLSHGGGKSVMIGDPHMPVERKELMVRAFASALAGEAHYIFGPDMGTDEACMAWIKDEIGRAVGLPRVMGGIPLDELGATGYGLAKSAEVAKDFVDLDLKGSRVAVQGFGNVGIPAAQLLAKSGALLVAAADSQGTIHDPEGLDIDALAQHKRDGNSVVSFGSGETLERDAVITVECDILIPAARPDVITEENVDDIKARLILQGANIPATEPAEQRLHERGVISIPDFIANAGGVICAAMEYARASEAAAFEAIDEKVTTNTRAVLERVRADGVLPRKAAIALAGERVRKAMGMRRFGVF